MFTNQWNQFDKPFLLLAQIEFVTQQDWYLNLKRGANQSICRNTTSLLLEINSDMRPDVTWVRHNKWSDEIPLGEYREIS